MGAYRADALISLGALAGQGLADAGVDPARWQAHIVLDLPTALGLANNPGELAGYGPIPGPVARQLAVEATWTKWVTEEGGGKLVDTGRLRYTPGPGLREFIVSRDQRCRFPGCEQPARRCDIDHAKPWDQGGQTSRENLGALCRRHHRIKTHTDWSITESGADGSCTWKTPTGETIRVEPEHPLSSPKTIPKPPDPPEPDPPF
ncbi:MAG: HNH endonuclease [Candidatus Nanopelagicales bacterium]|nr:HNH endonuclease [Candidatus Nanopelagicales bacterium]